MRAIGYFFAGYLILSIGPIGLMAGGATGTLTLLAAAAGMVALVRSYRRGRAPSGGTVQLILGAERPDVSALLRRLTRRAAELAERLPPDPLESDAFVAVRHALSHEPSEVPRAAESAYASARARLEAMQAEAERLTEDWRERAVTEGEVVAQAYRLTDRLADVESYADELQARAHESGEADDVAREVLLRAEAALAEAEKLPGVSLAELAGAREASTQATAALRPGQERPLSARRLAAEALRLAEAAAERADAARELPGDVERRRAAVAERHAAVADALGRIHDNLALAASRSARSCVVDVEAGEAAARQLVEQSSAAARAAEERAGAGDLPHAAEHLATALELLDQAEALVERIEAQLADLARTALAAREAVRRAEAATDAAWVRLEQGGAGAGVDGRRDVVGEARRLAERARAELSAPAPDWFEVRELSERATRLADALDQETGGVPEAVPDAGARDELERARDRATAAREDAWALALSAYATGAYRAAELTEAAYQEALALEAEAAAAPSSEATHRAIAAFREAERVARHAAAQADDERLQMSPGQGREVSGLVAAGALAALLGSAFVD